MVSCALADGVDTCPLPDSEDRQTEALHFAGAFERDYHDPQKFRFNLNALLAAITSAGEILQKEVERSGRIKEWNHARTPFKTDIWLNNIKRARNATLHQKAIFDGSQVEIGLYRWRRHKMSLGSKVRGDIHSRVLLAQWTSSSAGQLFLDPAHSAIGEQYGVWRRYNIKEVSESEDVLPALRRGLIRADDMLVVAHNLFGIAARHLDDEPLLSEEALASVSVLLESDVNPALPDQWGWPAR